MVANQLKAIFDPFVALDIQVWENFEKLGEIKNYPKEGVLKEANSTEKYLNVLLSGSGGNLIWNKNNFVCIDISYENDFLTDYMSFSLQKPTPIEVRLFENSTVFRVSYENFKTTLLEGNHGEKMTRIIAEFSFIEKQQQQIDLLTKTAKERYVELIKSHKTIERTPLKYLASYLGVTPQSLSRIRSGKI
ncbi:MAG: hypothetical protein AAGF85_21365 [Bacteroidota bacterium]